MPLLLLDLTGVLFDYDGPARMAAVAAATGRTVDDVRGRLFADGFFARCVRGEITEAQQRRHFRDALGWDAPDAEVDRVWSTGWTPRQATLDLLGELSAEVDRAVLTNNDPIMRAALGTQFPQLTAVVTTMLSAEQVGAPKPRREAFAGTLTLLGAAARDTHFIDDTRANVEAAIGVGIRARRFVDTEQLRADLADWGLLDG
ncbi:MAG: HAD hydrolase-like protein [Frankiaceae bacterium]|jgi:putative hydrolase of the HAD superfamily|nr:HAD hydrolase-like protein [Frankiaceae bacterium]